MGIRRNCHSATLAATAPLATPKTPSATVRSVAGQRTHRNPDAADIPLVQPTLQSLAMCASCHRFGSADLAAGMSRNGVPGRATPR